MGITVTLQAENGTSFAMVNDEKNILHRILPDADDPAFQWAGTIDWYGDTVFNARQAQALRQEWARLIVSAGNDEEASLLRNIDELLKRAAEGVHLYVKFIGD
jgi:hypothetical protein